MACSAVPQEIFILDDDFANVAFGGIELHRLQPGD